MENATVVGDGIDIHAEPGGGEMLHTLASPNDFGVERAFLVERDEVSLVTTEYRMEVDTGDFAFTVFDGGEEVRTGVNGAGEGETPTPEGHYYFPELLQPPDPEGPYGVYAFGLSGFSETLETFAGRPGQRHQRRGRPGPPGQPRACPVSNEDITWMAENPPIGTPVEISG
ncbi:L,D-transpeptidase [Nocardiopsis dassonvillei]|uniref:L,D-transpeptidase n=1 Tax=Nocardiopsis dassonvillei TaxID=2014 RepID=UPI00019EEB64|nr:L,D-transpeptidase [Nocardiopsis dassonvillei]